MSTELETIDTTTGEIVSADPLAQQSIAVRDSLVAWAESAKNANLLATSITKSSFVPQAFVGKPFDATVAIMKGAALGLDPIASLEALYVVHGKPALYARSMVAILLAAGHEIWTEEQTPESVTVCGRRRDSEHVERSTWTLQRAQLAGYTSNAKYKSNPEEMLYAKASAEVARRIAPDALMGLSYNVEELELDATEPVKIARKRKADDSIASAELKGEVSE
jgi:hypothetical protein